MTVRGLVGRARRLAPRLQPRRTAPSSPTRGSTPPRRTQLADRMTQLALNPAPILLVHRAPAPVRRARASGGRDAPDRRLRGPQRPAAPDLGDPGPGAAQRAGRGPGRLSGADRRRPPPVRGLPPHAGAEPGGAFDLGLAMLVDQEDTPLFLGPIHRVLTGVSLEDLAAAAEIAGAGTTWSTGRPPSRRWARTRWWPPTARCGRRSSWTCRRTGPRSRLLHDDVVPALGRAPPDPPPPLGRRHARPAAPGRRGGGPDARARRRRGAARGGRRPAAAGEGDVVPAQAQPGGAHQVAARRMTRPLATSTW